MPKGRFCPKRRTWPFLRKTAWRFFRWKTRSRSKNFDLIGFSLSSELNFTNVLQVLDLAGLPLFSAQRQDGFPLVGAGGIAVANPEPLRDHH